MDKTRQLIRLENLIKSGQDLSQVCKGQCSVPIYHNAKKYCTLAKGGTKFKCFNLYDFSDFPHACLYEKPKEALFQRYCSEIDENLGDC